jgi:DNA repair protein RadC
LTASLVHPREAFAPAIRASAAAVIFLHNHPSGDEAPSREDRELTSRLAACGRLLGIPMLDHIVIGADRYFSFADHRQMEPVA